MGDSSPIEAKSIRVAQASEGEPSLPESQRGEEKQEKDKSVEKKKERGKDHWVPRGRDARTYLKKFTRVPRGRGLPYSPESEPLR
ncbi:hypothetical protein TNCV_2164381 [Trichonephila clavipes]|nr:hypothetical protein TNCV_2164381 [Trichonephila clavipes]